jgi:hypothetical protein
VRRRSSRPAARSARALRAAPPSVRRVFAIATVPPHARESPDTAHRGGGARRSLRILGRGYRRLTRVTDPATVRRRAPSQENPRCPASSRRSR